MDLDSTQDLTGLPNGETGEIEFVYSTDSSTGGQPWYTVDLSPNVIISTTNYGTSSVFGNISGGYVMTDTTAPWPGQLQLDSDDADIVIQGKSLKAWMQQVEDRLNILTTNPELETQWEELRRLGDQYRALEKQLADKSQMWQRLKDMPPPKL